MKVKLTVLFLIGIASACSIVLLGDLQFTQIEEQYGFANWGGHTLSNYVRLLNSIDLTHLNLSTNGMSLHSRIDSEENTTSLFVFDSNRDDAILRIDVECCTNVLVAQKSMLWHFGYMTTTVDYSSSTNNIGDRGYTLPNSIIFARNNVAVDVSSYTNAISAEAVARQIDADILQRSTMANP